MKTYTVHYTISNRMFVHTYIQTDELKNIFKECRSFIRRLYTGGDIGDVTVYDEKGVRLFIMRCKPNVMGRNVIRYSCLGKYGRLYGVTRGMFPNLNL